MDILYAWLASISSGISPLVIKASSRSLVKSPWLFNILWVGFSIPLVVILAIVKGGGVPQVWTPLLLLSLSSAGLYIFYTAAIYKLDVTTVAPLFSLRTVFAVVLGALFLNETLSVLGIVLIAVTVLCSPFAAYEEHKKARAFYNKYVFIVVLAMASLALMGYFTNISVSRNGYATTLLWQDFLTLLMLLPTLKFVNFKHETISPRKLSPFVLLGLTGFGYIVTSTLAYAHNLALSSVIVSLPLSMVFAYLLARKYPRFLERHPAKVYKVRFTAAFVMVICAVWLSFL